jgi:hypothetical protein
MSLHTIRSCRRLVRCSCVGMLLLAQTLAHAEKIQVYRVPKEAPPSNLPAGHSADDGHNHGPGDGHNHDTPAPAAPKISYTTPEGWAETGAGEMRAAGFTIAGADGQSAQVAITPLPGMIGREPMIVNMWRQQVGMPELAEADAGKELTDVMIGAEAGKMFEIAGPSAGGATLRIMTAMLHRGNQSWFFKLQGNDELVAAQKVNFVAFLKSVKIEAAPAAALPEGHPPIGSAPRTPTAPVAATPRQGGPTWQVPAGWQEVSGGQFLFAKFLIAGEAGAQASVNVSVSAGDGGGLAANLNRWRAQLSQGPWSAAELQQNTQEIEVQGGKAIYVEMSGTDSSTEGPATILGAQVTRDGRTWYYKLMGETKLVAAQKNNFLQFVKGVKY